MPPTPSYPNASHRHAAILWLLDSDPAIGWQVLRDLSHEPDDVIARERSRIPTVGWGRTLLDRQRPDGKWGDGVSSPLWQSTLCTLVLLKDFGLDPSAERARRAIDLVRERVTWGPEFGDSPFFDGEVEPCINGRVLALGAYFNHPSEKLLNRLLGEQLADGGWNCDAECGSTRSSFHSTICVLEGLLEYERMLERTGTTSDIVNRIGTARLRGEQYLLDRKMHRRLSTGEPIIDRKGKKDWRQFAFPPTWHYDILRGLDYIRAAGVKPDERIAEAIEIVKTTQDATGRWPLHRHLPCPIGLEMETGDGEPSRWNTLRAMRVLAWYQRGGDRSPEPEFVS